jgi:outer membrane protein assembly factor BamB
MRLVNFPRALAVAPLLLFFAIFASACVSTENPSGWAAPVFDGNSLYFLASHDRLASAPAPTDAGTTIAWHFPDKNNKDQSNIKLQGVYGEPVVEGDTIYLTSYSGGVFALNKSNGVPKWRVAPL